MKKVLDTIIMMITLQLGISIILFVLKMIWYPPKMGMMMRHEEMVHYMLFWMKGTFIVMIMMVIMIISWLFLYQKK